jgi:hypothetical protein
VSVSLLDSILHPSKVRVDGGNSGVNVHLISVRTEETRLISRAFMLASSRGPPKPGSADAVQPTVAWLVGCSIVESRLALCMCICARLERSQRCDKRTACEEAVFGEDCYGVDEKYRDCAY